MAHDHGDRREGDGDARRDHGHHHHHDHGHGHDRSHHGPGPGHNAGARRPAQWQTPHLPEGAAPDSADGSAGPDFDLVETAFIRGFAVADDPTSFLRLAGIPFVATIGDGKRLSLLRVELSEAADVGQVAPIVGGGEFRYAPLPASLVSRRRQLAFAYHDGARVVRLSFAEARALKD